MQFRTFPNAKTQHVVTNISFDELVQSIKTPQEPVLNNILKARKYDKYKDPTNYNLIKTNNIPGYFPCLHGTGFIYLDIDGFKDQEQATAHKDYLLIFHADIIASIWLSLSGYGLSILVRCDNLNESNYKQYWDELNNIFDNRLDKDAKSYKKLNFFSYDPHIYYNPDSIIYTPAINPLLNVDSSQDLKTPCKESRYLGECNKGLVARQEEKLLDIQYRTRLPDSQYENINIPVIIPEGKRVLEIDLKYFLKFKIQFGARNRTIAALSMILITLNPEPVKRKQLLNALFSINRNYTVEPLTKYEVIKIFNANYERFKEQGFLDVEKYYNKDPKYVFWHKNCQYSAYEKRRIGQELLLKARGKGKENSEEIIHNAIEDLQDNINPITRQRICDITKLSLRTVSTYWKRFRCVVDDYNASLKAIKNMNEEEEINEAGTNVEPVMQAPTLEPLKEENIKPLPDMAEAPEPSYMGGEPMEREDLAPTVEPRSEEPENKLIDIDNIFGPVAPLPPNGSNMTDQERREILEMYSFWDSVG